MDSFVRGGSGESPMQVSRCAPQKMNKQPLVQSQDFVAGQVQRSWSMRPVSSGCPAGRGLQPCQLPAPAGHGCLSAETGHDVHQIPLAERSDSALCGRYQKILTRRWSENSPLVKLKSGGRFLPHGVGLMDCAFRLRLLHQRRQYLHPRFGWNLRSGSSHNLG